MGKRPTWGAEVRKNETARGPESGIRKRHVQEMGLFVKTYKIILSRDYSLEMTPQCSIIF